MVVIMNRRQEEIAVILTGMVDGGHATKDEAQQKLAHDILKKGTFTHASSNQTE